MIITRSALLRMRHVSERNCREILCTINFLFRKSVIYEIMCKYIVESDRTQMTIWRMRFASWIPKATNTHSEYVIAIALPQKQWLRERASMLRYSTLSILLVVIKIERQICSIGIYFLKLVKYQFYIWRIYGKFYK
jgi:hypothetical protein